MNKFMVGLLACGLFATTLMPSFAADIADVSSNYWASKEINEVVDDNIMTLSSGNFNPEGSVRRVDFVQALLKLLSNENLNVNISNNFSDVYTSDYYYNDVLRSQQLGLVYGYPDGTFQPKKLMSRSETHSVISHITKDMDADTAVLNNYKDASQIADWAQKPYAKTLNYGIYVNYPNADELRPNDVLSRAEAAVILARLKEKLGLVKNEYLGGVEHFAYAKKAPNNEVKVGDNANYVHEGNVIPVAFSEKFKSDKSAAGDALTFVAKEDISTKEGTVIFPAGTKFNAQINEIQDPKWFNKNARVYAEITSAELPCGKSVDLNAKPFTKKYDLKEGPWMTAGKLALYTVSGGAVGTAAGVGFAFIPDPTKIGTGIAIGAPVGAGVGLATGLITKGLNYHAKEGEVINVILLKDAKVSKVKPAL